MLDIKCCYHWFVTILWIKDILHQDAQSNATPCDTVIMQWFVHFLSPCFSYLERVQCSHQELYLQSVKQKRSYVYSQMLQYNLKTAVAWIIKIHWRYVLCSSSNTYLFLFILIQEFRQKVMLGTPFLVIWLVGFIADLDIDSWLIKGLMYGGVWAMVQFLSK